MKRLIGSLFFSMVVFLTSCDCNQNIFGTVVDAETGKALVGARVHHQYKEHVKTTTDSLGVFDLSTISGGFSCPPMPIFIEMEGYKRVETKIPNASSKVIKLERE